jgi:hypothetical protein
MKSILLEYLETKKHIQSRTKESASPQMEKQRVELNTNDWLV